MRYLADILTLIRFILAIVLFVMAIFGGSPAAAFTIFIIGELTDAFDGTCATRWPFPKNKTPRYRKYAAKYDMIVDMLIAATFALFFINRVNLVAGLIIGVGYSALAIILDFIVYGKVFGHPDDATPHSLTHRNFPLAKRLVLARRNLYLALMFTVSAWVLYASEWPMPVKITITVIACAVSLFLWFFLSQRRHNISRDAVDIERKLSK
ncbi:CDP-alcohol phosphatidyltransferase family protein [Candidatus Saccharibacteria bacterium]|nr:CDP-alcohol phosphatidyltransferase family protein [Candidatus Saccharibacteria bacterium]